MASTIAHPVTVVPLIVLGLAIAAMGMYVGEIDDAPGAGGIGLLLMLAAVAIGVQTARNRMPLWIARTALVLAIVVAGFAAVLTRSVAAAAPLFVLAATVPSVSTPTPSTEWMTAIERARPMVRAAIMAQNLPSISIAVGAGSDVVWAEGFGWRDVVTETPVTPETRFNIGSAAPAVARATRVGLAMVHTGAEPATEWSPDHVGEPEEDFPGFTAIHDLILRPLGVSAPRQPLPGDRATFYVPATAWRNFSTNPRTGRRLMYMRDLACCAEGKAFYSTPSDLVRFGLATGVDDMSGELAGGPVMSLTTRRDRGIVVVVTSNMAYASTAALAGKVAEAFGG